MDAGMDPSLVRLQSSIFRSINLQVKGVFASVHLSNQMSRTAIALHTRNPLWADEFTFEVIDPNDVVKIFIMEDKKKRVQKKVGEIRVILATLPANEKTEAWLPIAGDKNKTVGDVRLRVHYVVDVILPSIEYQPFLELLGAEDLEIIRLLSRFARENKSEVARDLVHIFQSKGRVEWLIGQLLKEEVQSTDSQEVLFRSNSVCTKALDHYMKFLGQEYLTCIVKPLVHAIQKLTMPLEIDKNRLTSNDDWKKNIKVIQIILDDLIGRLATSVDQCPVPLRRLFSVIDRLAAERFPNAEKIRYTAVGGFIFLRFIVPAILNPKLFSLMDSLPDEKQARSLSVLAGVLQKIANTTKYRDGEDYLCNLNDFITVKMTVTKDFIDKLIDVPAAPVARVRSMTRRASVSSSPLVQLEHHIASLLRELEPVLPKFKDEMFRPNVVKMLEILDRLQTRIKEESTALDIHELSPDATSTLDSLVSDLIKSSNTPTDAPQARSRSATSAGSAPAPPPASNRKTVKRLKKKTYVTPAVDSIFAIQSGATKPSSMTGLPQRPGSPGLDSELRRTNSTMGAKLGGPIANIRAFIAPGTQEKQIGRAASPPPRGPLPEPPVDSQAKPTTAAGALLQNLRRDQLRKGSAPPVPSFRKLPPPANTASGATAPQTALSPPRGKALAPHRDPALELLDDGVPVESPSIPEIPMAEAAELRDIEVNEAHDKSEPSSASGSSRALQDLHMLLQQAAEEDVTLDPAPESPPAPSVPRPTVPPPAAPTPAVVEAPSPKKPVGLGISSLTMPVTGVTLGVMPTHEPELITPRRGMVSLSPRQELEVEFADEIPPDAVSDLSASTAADDSDDDIEEDEIEEVEVIDMASSNKFADQINQELSLLYNIVDEIMHAELPATPRQRPPEEVIPEIVQLDDIVTQLADLEMETSRKAREEYAKAAAARRKSVVTPQVICYYCNTNILPGQSFLMALGKHYHDNHLLCASCNCDLSQTGLHDYEGRPYCPNCYTRTIKQKNAPKCAGCQQPILEDEYFTALEQTWHVEHFVCTTCRQPFDDGQFFNINGKPYCERHSHQAKPKQSRGICEHCQQDIFDSEYMEAQGKKYHKEHFLCDKCGQPMEGMFVLFDKGRKKACAHHFQK